MKKEKTFEENIALLEEIVEKLENPDTSLEEAMKLFGEGVALSGECAEKLEKAKQAVHILVDGGEKKVEKEFSADE